MAEAFDPYVQWLGRQGGQRPSNHYELLGIGLFQSDPAVVARAADTLTARIRGIRPGPHVAEWQRLLDAVAGAKSCLMDPAAKAAYDALLRGDGGRPGPSSPPIQGTAPAAATPVPPQASPVVSHDVLPGSFPDPAAHRRRSTNAKPSTAQMAVYGLTVVFLAMAATFGYMLYQRRGTGSDRQAISGAEGKAVPAQPAGSTERPGPSGPAQRKKAPLTTVEGPRPAAKSKSRKASEAKATTGGHAQTGPNLVPPDGQAARQKTAANVPPVDERRQKAWREAVADLRFSMSEHDVVGAQKHLQAALANAQTPDERAQVNRLDTLLGHLEEFWKGMSRIVARLESAEVIPVGDSYVAIVEVSPEKLTIKVEGQLRTYQIDRMPPRLVQALAEAGFGDDPATKVIVGTYFLVDPEADRARARQLWQEAARGGIDVKDIAPELGQWQGPSPASGSPTPRTTARPPSAQKIQQAEQTVREKFKGEYEQATSASGKARLAKLLFEAGEATGEDSDLRFVLLGEARDLAVAAGDSVLALQAIDQIAAFYQLDATPMKIAALTGAVENARGSSAHRDIAQNALELTRQAVEAGRLDDADKLAEVALAAARKSNNRPLMQQAVLVIQQLDALKKQAGSPPR